MVGSGLALDADKKKQLTPKVVYVNMHILHLGRAFLLILASQVELSRFTIAEKRNAFQICLQSNDCKAKLRKVFDKTILKEDFLNRISIINDSI